MHVALKKLTEDTVLGLHGAHAAKPVQPVTRSERDTVTTHDLQMAGKTAPNWALHVKHSCANRGHHVMVSMSFLLVRALHPQTLKCIYVLCNQDIRQTFELMIFIVLGSYSLFILLLLGDCLLILNLRVASFSGHYFLVAETCTTS